MFYLLLSLTSSLQLSYVLYVVAVSRHEMVLTFPSSHDWPDTQAKQILSGIRKAMKLESRLLISQLLYPVARYGHSTSNHPSIDELVIKSTVRAFDVTDSGAIQQVGALVFHKRSSLR